MKLLHVSDLHLGISLCGKNLIHEQWSLPEILADAASDCEAVLLAGDIFDSAAASSEAIRLYDAIVTRLCLREGKKVIAIAGNHDGAARLSSCSALLRKSGLFVFGRLQNPVEYVDLGDCVVWVLPYFSNYEASILFPDDNLNPCIQPFERITEHIRSRMDNRPNILLSHCFVAGGQVGESDMAARLGGATAVPTSIFKGFDYVALGHLHCPQLVGSGNIIRYCGSPFPYSFGEVRSMSNGFSCYDTQTAEFRHVNIEPPYQLVTLELPFEEMIQIGQSGKYSDALVKIVMTDRFAGQETYRQLKQFFPEILQFSGAKLPEESAELTLEQVESFSSEELLIRFLQERTGQPPNDEQLNWFREGVESVLREEGEARQ